MIDQEVLAPAPARQLVKDGVWQVPPEQRPRNWQTMAVRECEETETKTHTRRKRTTEIVVRESGQNRLLEIQEQISRWRKSKKKVDRPLSHWIARNQKQLRHIGIGSAAIKDLWRVFQTGIMLEMELADSRIARVMNGKAKA